MIDGTKTEKTVVQYGMCEYCGQQVALQIPEWREDDFDQDALNFMATQNCSCKEGDSARKQRIEIESAINTIELYTKNMNEECAKEIMTAAVEKIARSEIKSLTVKLFSGATYKMTEKDGHVLTERSETITDSVTA